jgi:hypothetical protein
MLFQVKAADWRADAVVAALIPARRGARADPMMTPRQE